MKFFRFLNNYNTGFQHSNRIARIWYLRKLYFKIVYRYIFRLGLTDIFRSQFPYFFKDSTVPPSLAVEFTNVCNMHCLYCTSPQKLREKGFMNDLTFAVILKQINENHIKRVRIVGNGEPTLHKNFDKMIRSMKSVIPVLSLTTNGNFISKNIIKSIVDSGVDVVNFSVDSNNKADYESRRIGANFDSLLENISGLKEYKRIKKSKILINIRIMLTPEDIEKKDDIISYWKQYGDVVSVQYVSKIESSVHPNPYKNMFISSAKRGVYPKCSLPFKGIDIHWNGNVPICSIAELQSSNSNEYLLGNVNTESIVNLWNNSIINKYRNAHRNQILELMPLCNGCIGT